MQGIEVDTFYIIISIIIIFVGFFIRIWFVLFIIRLISNAIKRTRTHNYFKKNVVTYSLDELKNLDVPKKGIYKDVSLDKLEKFNTSNIETLKDYFYNIFLKFETAYNNLDYNMMKLLSTKQLFQNYYTGISLDLGVGQKKIIDQIKRKKVIIYELDSTIAKQTLSAMIEISYITYTINRNGNIISGNRYNPVTEKFEVTFRKDFENRDITTCPNCGAEVVGKKCEYCRVNIKSSEFSISSIKRIIEK